jgi:hypothetical protein
MMDQTSQCHNPVDPFVCIESNSTLGPTQPPIQWLLGCDWHMALIPSLPLVPKLRKTGTKEAKVHSWNQILGFTKRSTSVQLLEVHTAASYLLLVVGGVTSVRMIFV